MSESEKKTQNSSSHERAVKGYLHPSLVPAFDKYVEEHETSVSRALNDAVRVLLGKIPSTEKKTTTK